MALTNGPISSRMLGGSFHMAEPAQCPYPQNAAIDAVTGRSVPSCVEPSPARLLGASLTGATKSVIGISSTRGEYSHGLLKAPPLYCRGLYRGATHLVRVATLVLSIHTATMDKRRSKAARPNGGGAAHKSSNILGEIPVPNGTGAIPADVSRPSWEHWGHYFLIGGVTYL